MSVNLAILDDRFTDDMRLVERGAYLCYQCGTCTAACPLGVPVRRTLRSAQLGLKDHVITDDLWRCATCGLCELRCPRGVKIIELIRAFRIRAFEERKAPAKLEQALWGVYEDGNPWGGKKADRAKWAEGLDLKEASGGVKNLLYVGCAASFDPRLQRVARAVARTMKEAGVDFGILGERESCCGDVIYHTGEEGFLEELIQGNLETFKKTGA